MRIYGSSGAEHYEVESTNYNSGRSQRTDIATKKIAWSVAAIRKDPGLLPLAERQLSLS